MKRMRIGILEGKIFQSILGYRSRNHRENFEIFEKIIFNLLKFFTRNCSTNTRKKKKERKIGYILRKRNEPNRNDERK